MAIKSLTGKMENSFQEQMQCQGLMLKQLPVHLKHDMPH